MRAHYSPSPRFPVARCSCRHSTPRNISPIVKALNMDFLKPAKSDVTVEISMTTEQIAGIQAEAYSNGKAEFVLKGELKDSTGVVVAESHGVYQIRKII